MLKFPSRSRMLPSTLMSCKWCRPSGLKRYSCISSLKVGSSSGKSTTGQTKSKMRCVYQTVTHNHILSLLSIFSLFLNYIYVYIVFLLGVAVTHQAKPNRKKTLLDNTTKFWQMLYCCRRAFFLLPSIFFSLSFPPDFYIVCLFFLRRVHLFSFARGESGIRAQAATGRASYGRK